MTLSELVFTVRGRDDTDAVLLERAEQVVPAVLARGVMIDITARDHVFDVIHDLAAKHDVGVKVADVCLDRVCDALKNGCLPVSDDLGGLAAHDISGLACNRWTPEVTAAYYLGLAVGYRLARRLSE